MKALGSEVYTTVHKYILLLYISPEYLYLYRVLYLRWGTTTLHRDPSHTCCQTHIQIYMPITAVPTTKVPPSTHPQLKTAARSKKLTGELIIPSLNCHSSTANTLFPASSLNHSCVPQCLFHDTSDGWLTGRGLGPSRELDSLLSRTPPNQRTRNIG